MVWTYCSSMQSLVAICRRTAPGNGKDGIFYVFVCYRYHGPYINTGIRRAHSKAYIVVICWWILAAVFATSPFSEDETSFLLCENRGTMSLYGDANVSKLDQNFNMFVKFGG